MSRKRRNLTAEQKADVVRWHVIDKVPVSDLAREFSIQPSKVHQWIAAVLGHAEKAFDSNQTLAVVAGAGQQQVSHLEASLRLGQ